MQRHDEFRGTDRRAWVGPCPLLSHPLPLSPQMSSPSRTQWSRIRGLIASSTITPADKRNGLVLITFTHMMLAAPGFSYWRQAFRMVGVHKVIPNLRLWLILQKLGLKDFEVRWDVQNRQPVLIIYLRPPSVRIPQLPVGVDCRRPRFNNFLDLSKPVFMSYGLADNGSLERFQKCVEDIQNSDDWRLHTMRALSMLFNRGECV